MRLVQLASRPNSHLVDVMSADGGSRWTALLGLAGNSATGTTVQTRIRHHGNIDRNDVDGVGYLRYDVVVRVQRATHSSKLGKLFK